MEFGFTKEQEKLRKELHDYYMKMLPADYDPRITPMSKELQSFWTKLQKKAGEKRYLTPGWPKEYGGMGLGSIEQGIVQEVESYFSVNWPARLAFHLLGPGLIMFGTEEQKKEFIPLIARGEQVWFEAFTEAEAGSDEANQQTRAVPDGDYFVINGRKVFISGAYKPHFLYTEVRTADTMPKHRGLTLFMIPADLRGITFRPMPTMGHGTQNEIIFENVRVHKKYMLGELNRGFYHAMEVFTFERAGTAGPADAERNLQEFVQFCKKEKRNGKPLIKDPEVRKKLARMAVENKVRRLIGWHAQWWFGKRDKLGPKPYDLSGFFQKLLTNRHADMMMEILGHYGQLQTGSKYVKYDGRIEHAWLVARSLHAGGTFEVNKIVLAGRGLGLPRVPAKFNKQITEALREIR
jgi:alkylation response protein AidB-like acyl-CoA dehydrogenase